METISKPCVKMKNFGWIHLHHTCIAVVLAHCNILVSLGRKTIEMSRRQMQ